MQLINLLQYCIKDPIKTTNINDEPRMKCYFLSPLKYLGYYTELTKKKPAKPLICPLPLSAAEINIWQLFNHYSQLD